MAHRVLFRWKAKDADHINRVTVIRTDQVRAIHVDDVVTRLHVHTGEPTYTEIDLDPYDIIDDDDVAQMGRHFRKLYDELMADLLSERGDQDVIWTYEPALARDKTARNFSDAWPPTGWRRHPSDRGTR